MNIGIKYMHLKDWFEMKPNYLEKLGLVLFHQEKCPVKTCNMFILFKKATIFGASIFFSFDGKPTVWTTCVFLYLLVAFLQIEMISFV